MSIDGPMTPPTKPAARLAGVRIVSATARASNVASGIVAPPKRSFIVAVPVPMTSGSQIATRPTRAPARTIRATGGSGTRAHMGLACFRKFT
jgi:hypothetical protein